MAGENGFEDRLETAVEGLVEDERLRSQLADDEAEVLLGWGERQLEIAARTASALRDQDEAGAAFDGNVQRVRAVMRSINDLVGKKDSIADDEMRQRLTELLASSGASTASEASAVDEMMSQRRNMSTLDLVTRLTSLAGGFQPIEG